MMHTTNNGWSKDPLTVRIYIGSDRDGAQVAAGSVASVFEAFLTRFNAEVEPIYSVNGYRSAAFNATLPGAVASSNHVSGTAVDVNGDRHPNEAAHAGRLMASGFSTAQLAKLHHLLADFPVIVWGGDTSTKFPLGARDYMHFEIRGTAAQVTTAANVLTRPRPPIVVPPPLKPLPVLTPLPQEDDMKVIHAPNGSIALVGESYVGEFIGTDTAGYGAAITVFGPLVEVSDAEYVTTVQRATGRMAAARAGMTAQEVAAAVIPSLTASVTAALKTAGGGGLTIDQVEQAIRHVLGSLG